eukprot:CAMPEP_0179268518 /NCGR_PEP_ID=MMETSP0797-20121207/30483_1 /TAXON_ID=47934 /ORGANISM="Dinophysis acuminata, Strain DAEP01" /LENGTH=114 /DNA_ID=CAMNT_0020976805 /DNA_START=44 /DNA_END=388 /DNA_ORIENTATION=-
MATHVAGRAAGKATDEGGSSSGSAAQAPPDERSNLRDCGDCTLDCFSFMGRSAVTASRGTYRAAASATYPVKEAVVGAVDGTSNYLHPHQKRLPAAPNAVPTFSVGASARPPGR